MTKGLFVVFEGLDGAGKSTQARKFHAWLTQTGQNATLTREPGGTPMAETLRSLLVQGTPDTMNGMMEALLFNAARHDHLRKVILPEVKKGTHVVCDRYFGSTLALQTASGMDPNTLWALHDIACDGVVPDLTIMLTGNTERLLKRAQQRENDANGETSKENRFEEKGLAYHLRVKEGFERHMTWDHVVKIEVEDANGNMRSVDDIFEEVKEAWKVRVGTNQGQNDAINMTL